MKRDYSKIDPTSKASFKTLDFAIYKLSKIVAKKRKVSEKLKSGKGNPQFKVLKARMGGALKAQFDGNLTYGKAQELINATVVPNEIMNRVKDLKDLKEFKVA